MSDNVKFVTYRGTTMTEGWPEKITAAQKQTHVIIDGIAHERIKYGAEDWMWTKPECRGCAVLRGEYHVPGCDMEQCPVCRDQAFGCNCSKSISH